jgi:ATP-dependent exoDNAse (exonuclease V) alpha subunit
MDLEREALARRRDKGVTIDDIRREIARRPDLIVASPADARNARVTTVEAAQRERDILDLAQAGRGQAEPIPARLNRYGLGEDQERAARHVLETADRVLAIEGRAGTGKSYTLQAVAERAREAGWKVRGCAPTTSAAAILRELGIDSTTLGSLYIDRQIPGGPQLWIVDEAGLISSKDMRHLLDTAKFVRAKVALVGDPAQHRAVEAGSPFAMLLDRHAIAVERLTTVRRQQDEDLKRAVVSASRPEGAREAVDLLGRQGRVVEIPDQRQRHERIAQDFVSDGGRGIVVAPSNAERADLNKRIREKLIEAGAVDRHSFKAPVVVKQDRTLEQKRRAASFTPDDILRFTHRTGEFRRGDRARVVGVDPKRNHLLVRMLPDNELREVNPNNARGFEVERFEERRFAVGDRVQFRERDRDLGVTNGALGTIKRLDERGRAVVEVGRRQLKVDLREPRALDHAYAITSHRSQGLTRERVYLSIDTRHSEELVNTRQFYVSISRAVQDVRVYTDDWAKLARAVSRLQTDESALALLESVERPPEAARLRPRRPGPLDMAEVIPLSREEIRRSPALMPAYKSEYKAALAFVPDKELAREVALLNVSARAAGREPVITPEVIERLIADEAATAARLPKVEMLRDWFTRSLASALWRAVGPTRPGREWEL